MKGDKLFNWIADSLQNAAAVLAVFALVFCVGVDMVFFLPARQKDAALISTKVSIDEVDGRVTTTVDRFKIETIWFEKNAGYVEDASKKLQDAKGLLSDETENGARKLLARATSERKVPKALELTEQAKKSLEQASQLVKEVNERLDQNQALRASVRQSVLSISQLVSTTQPVLSTALVRLSEEQISHLAKYTSQSENALSHSEGRMTQVNEMLMNAVALMPADTDVSGAGNPTMAQAELDKAKALIDEINTLMSKVTADLDYLKKTRENASQKVADSKTTYAQSKNYVDGLQRQTSFWFNAAYESLKVSAASRDGADSALVTVVEDGKVDLPLAYESAVSSIQNSMAAVSSVDGEISDEQSARSGSLLITSRVSQVNVSIGQAINAQSTMQLYHNISTWTGVSGHVSTAKSLVQQAIANAAKALDLIKLEIQKFADGKAEANNGLTKLDQAQGLAVAVVDRKSTLESSRSQWSSAEQSAASMINSERANVQNYGAYDGGAVNSFNTAVSQLNSAQSHASSGFYEEAVNEASAAYSNASGTGSRAYQAYESEMERQRQARAAATRQAIAEEEARQQAAADAARRASQQNDYDYGGSSSSGSSCCSGGGSSGGGSSYGGGGSDSNYGGGGSDSDY